MSAMRRSSSSGWAKCRYRPPDQVPRAVWVGSSGMPTEGYAGRGSGTIRPMRRHLVLVAVLVVGLLAGGWGGGGGGGTAKEEYRQDLARTSQDVQKTFADILGGTG